MNTTIKTQPWKENIGRRVLVRRYPLGSPNIEAKILELSPSEVRVKLKISGQILPMWADTENVFELIEVLPDVASVSTPPTQPPSVPMGGVGNWTKV